MREIGSEYWTGCTPTCLKECSMRAESIYETHSYKVLETLSGRTALEHIVEILEEQGKKKAYLPSYCCHTMIEPFLKHGMEVQFYDVQTTDNGLRRIIHDGDYEVILLMDYFGHIDEETKRLAIIEKKKGNTVIYDATHSMYGPIDTMPYDFIYGSYRKWVDINCGFLAWKEELCHGEITQSGLNTRYALIREELFDKKADYIHGRLTDKDLFLPLINEAENILEQQYHHQAPDKRSLEVLKRTDAEYIKYKRMENARVLTEAVNEIHDERVCSLTPLLNTYDVPLFVPILVNKDYRDSLRKYLVNKQIYCPVHWPVSEMHEVLQGSKKLFEWELSLICDQRYDENDMFRIAGAIEEYLKKN